MHQLENLFTNTVDALAVYFAVRRAKDADSLYTDSRARLTDALDLSEGEQIGAIYEVRRKIGVTVQYVAASGMLDKEPYGPTNDGTCRRERR